MSNRLYDIINTFNNLVAKNEPTKHLSESAVAKPQTKLEETMAKVESDLKTFKEAKKAKPDFLDVDKDGNKKEPMKKAAKEKDLDESAAPGQEAWIKKNKERFVKQYGKKKGMEVLYATAWKRSKNEDAHDVAVSEEDPVFEGDDYWDFKDLKDKPTSGTRKVSGTRYGGSSQKDDDDEEETTNKPAGEKRGRGRPKGTGKKMGHQGPTGKSKLMSKGAIKESRPSLMDRLLDETYSNFGEDASDLTLDQDQLRQHIGDENFEQLRRAIQVTGTFPEAMYDALYDYFSETGEMPYGAATAEDEDPYNWIHQKLDQMFGDEVGYDQENVDIDMGEPDEDYGTYGDDERPEEDEMNSESVNESKQMVAESMQQIVHSYPHEIKRFVNTGEMDSDLYSALFDYYFNAGEMPYGTAKGRDGDPMEWVSMRFDQDVNELQLEEDTPEFIRRPAAPAMTPSTAPVDDGLGAELNELARLAGLKESIGECGDMSPFTQTSQPDQQSGMSINTNVDTRTGTKTMTVTADGEVADKLAEILSLSGLAGQVNTRSSEVVTQDPEQEPAVQVVAVGEDKDERYKANTTPEPEVVGVDAIVDQGDDLNRKKKQHADKPKLGDNPMATEGVKLSKSLMRELESIKIKK